MVINEPLFYFAYCDYRRRSLQAVYIRWKRLLRAGCATGLVVGWMTYLHTKIALCQVLPTLIASHLAKFFNRLLFHARDKRWSTGGEEWAGPVYEKGGVWCKCLCSTCDNMFLDSAVLKSSRLRKNSIWVTEIRVFSYWQKYFQLNQLVPTVSC